MELIINDDYTNFYSFIYLRRRENHKIYIIGYNGECLEEQPLEANLDQKIKPLLIIPFGMKQALLTAFANHAKQENISTENENLMKGKLQAVQTHLDDMRTQNQKMLDALLTAMSEKTHS